MQPIYKTLIIKAYSILLLAKLFTLFLVKMAASLASIAETWPENVLPCSLRSRPREAIGSRKCASQKIFARPYTDILRVRMDFLHEVQFSAAIEAAHFPAETTRPLGRGCLPFSPFFQCTHRHLFLIFFIKQFQSPNQA